MSLGALIEKFRVVALDRVERMNLLMVQLERDLDDSAVVDELMREVHTLKGEANMMGFADITLVAHQVEHMLLGITTRRFESSRAHNDLTFEGLDIMRQLLTKSVGSERRPADLAGFVDRVARARMGAVSGMSEASEVFEISENLDVFGGSEGPGVSEISEAFESYAASEVSDVFGSGEEAKISALPAVFESGRSRKASEGLEQSGEEEVIAVEVVESASGGLGGQDSRGWEQSSVDGGLGAATRTRIESSSYSTGGVAGSSAGQSVDGARASDAQLRIQGGGSLRVNLDKLEELGDISADVLLLSRRFEHRLNALEEIRRDFRGWLSENDGNLPKSQQLAVRNLVHRLDAFETTLSEEAYLVCTRAGHLDDQSRRLRHVSLAQVLSHYPRAVRDLARNQGKRIRMVHEFGDVEVDRAILTALSEPLLHLIRNAVDHGIESPEERALAGKDEEGEIGLQAEYVGDGVRVVLHDDGRGIDPGEIRKKAVKRGLITEEQARGLSDQGAIALIFEPGFTTRDVVSDVSGRGVGMDVVRRQISRLSGYIEVESEVGRGSNFVLYIPLSSAVSSILMIEIGGENYAVAAGDIERVEIIAEQDLRRVHGRMNVYSERELIPFVDWKGLLGLRERGVRSELERGEFRVLIIKKGMRRAAVLIDEVVGEREALTRPLGEFLSGVGLCQAVALTAASEVVPMLDVLALLARAEGETGVSKHVMGEWRGDLVTDKEAGEGKAGKKVVLVVEDSAITRTLVTSILREAGYIVLEAEDGKEGMRVLGDSQVDLVLTDVQMPRMDGLALLRAVRADAMLEGMPVIVLSMLGEQADKERAMALGANGYLVKLNFSEQALLQSVRRWV